MTGTFARGFDFTPSADIVSSEVDAEFNTIFAALNGLLSSDNKVNLIEPGVLTPAMSLTGLTTFKSAAIATEQSRTDTAYGTLTTPDQITGVVLPTDGLIVVLYQATWKESVAAAARAALFIGATQYKVAVNATRTSGGASTTGTVTAAAKINNGAATGAESILGSAGPYGLVGAPSFQGAHAGNVTTGQGVGCIGGLGATASDLELGSDLYPLDPQSTRTSVVTYGTIGVGNPAYIFAAAGTYDISVQFKASSGSVTAKDRKLWVAVFSPQT